MSIRADAPKPAKRSQVRRGSLPSAENQPAAEPWSSIGAPRQSTAATCAVVPAGLERLDALQPLWAALQAHHASVGPQFGPIRPPEESWARMRQRYAAWLEAGDAFVLIAEEGGAAIGYAFVHIGRGSDTWATTDRVAELETLSVLPSARRRGVGSALMAAVLSELRRRNVREWRVGVVATNPDAVRFYERYLVVPTMLFFVGRVPEGSRE